MTFQNNKTFSNPSISIIMMVVIVMLLNLLLTQGNLSENDESIFPFYNFFLFTVLQTAFVIVYKKNYKTFAFWIMLISILACIVFGGLLWYAWQLGSGFNH